MSLSRRPWLFFGPAALAAAGAAVALTFTSDHDQHPAHTTALVLFVSLSFIAAGLIGWTRRPANRTGMLMVAVGFGVLADSLYEANSSLPYTLGTIVGSLFIAAFVHLLLAYPGGRLISRFGRSVVVGAYATAFFAPLFDALFPSRPKPCKPEACPDNLVLVSHNHAAHVAETALWTAVAVVLFAAAFWLLVGRWRRGTPALRRQLRIHRADQSVFEDHGRERMYAWRRSTTSRFAPATWTPRSNCSRGASSCSRSAAAASTTSASTNGTTSRSRQPTTDHRSMKSSVSRRRTAR